MANLAHLFKVNQKVKIKNDDFDAIQKFYNGVIKEVYTDHIIVTNKDLDFDGYYEEGFNMDCIFPDYNF